MNKILQSRVKILVTKRIKNEHNIEYRFSLIENKDRKFREIIWVNGKEPNIFLEKVRDILYNKNIKNYDKIQNTIRYSKTLKKITGDSNIPVESFIIKEIQNMITILKKRQFHYK